MPNKTLRRIWKDKKQMAVIVLSLMAIASCAMWFGNFGIFAPQQATINGIEVSNIQVYSDQPAQQGSRTSIFVDLKNTADVYVTKDVEVCILPDSWVTAGELPFTVVPMTSFVGTPGCCQANEFCQTMKVTMNPNSLGGHIFTPYVPSQNSYDHCNSQGTATDLDNKYWVVVGVVESCPSWFGVGRYSSYKILPFSVYSTDIECHNDAKCGESDWSGGYYCIGSKIMRNYVTQKCVNPGTTASYCSRIPEAKEIGTCQPDMGTQCVNGKAECQDITCDYDEVCEQGETYDTCPSDCDKPPTCGNNVCDEDESFLSCMNDCPPSVAMVAGFIAIIGTAAYLIQQRSIQKRRERWGEQ